MVLKSSSDMLFSQISLVYLSYVWAPSVLSPKMRRSWDSKPSQDPRPQLRALKGPRKKLKFKVYHRQSRRLGRLRP